MINFSKKMVFYHKEGKGVTVWLFLWYFLIKPCRIAIKSPPKRVKGNLPPSMGVVRTGMLDDVMVIVMVIWNLLFMAYVRIHSLWWTISWQPSLDFMSIGQLWAMWYGDSNILPLSILWILGNSTVIFT